MHHSRVYELFPPETFQFCLCVCVTNSGRRQGVGGRGRGRGAMYRELDFIQGQNLKHLSVMSLSKSLQRKETSDIH